MSKAEKAPNGAKPRGKAPTAEILGVLPRPDKVPAKWSYHHAQLIKLRDSLAGQRRDRTANGQAEPAVAGLHMADAATDSYDRDWALAMASSDQSLLYEVDEALSRIAGGTFGICELTGRPIEANRLRALPWTRFSAAAQAELEQRGATTRTHLGQLGVYESMGGDTTSPDEEDLEEPSTERQAA